MILIAEDEPKIAALLADYLNAAGFDTRWVANGNDVITAFREDAPELILLDLMLPGRDGLTLCREIRQTSAVPIVMVTARVDEIDRLIGLEMGADDYICKPFSPREVLARVKAIIRRVRHHAAAPNEPSPLRIDSQYHGAWLDEHPLNLTPVEFRLLHTLWQSQGKILSRDQLMDGLYPDNRIVTDRTVDTHVKNLRRKLESVRADATLIRSIYGVGYKLEF